jgi:hypothetical protein
MKSPAIILLSLGPAYIGRLEGIGTGGHLLFLVALSGFEP